MWQDWFGTTWQIAGLSLLSAVAMFASVLIATRINGLRSFSKMSSFDFAVTVAVGSLLASVAVYRTISLGRGLAVLLGLYGTQYLVAQFRVRADGSRYVDNSPMLLMAGQELLPDNLRKVRVTESDIRAKLRQAGVRTYDEVIAVVLESTGDISVLSGEGRFDPDILRGVVGAERLQHPD